MTRQPKPLFDLKTFVLLLFALLVGIAAWILTYLHTGSPFQAVLFGGGATGAALAWANSMVSSSDEG